VSPVGGLRQRSVFGGAESMKEPIHSGMASEETFKALKDALLGVIVGIGSDKCFDSTLQFLDRPGIYKE
jgi:hypothetical protein